MESIHSINGNDFSNIARAASDATGKIEYSSSKRSTFSSSSTTPSAPSPRKHALTGRVVPPEQMIELKQTMEYNAACSSILETLFLQRFWFWVSSYVPLWIMPSTITFTGLALNLLTYVILLFYSWDAKTEAPRWVYVLSGLGMFLYQLFDALDGKQSHKMQNTWVEDFTDHACDSLSQALIPLGIAVTMQLYDCPEWFFVGGLVGVITFYIATWHCYVVNAMIFGKLDVSEAQLTIVAMYMVTAIVGPGIWHYKVTWLSVELRTLLLLLFTASSVIASGVRLHRISGGQSPLKGVKRKEGPAVWYPAIPMVTVITMATASYSMFLVDPVLFMLMFGFVFAKLGMALMVAQMGKGDAQIYDTALLWPLFLWANQRLALLSHNASLWIVMILALTDALRYLTCACLDIRDMQDVWIFWLKYPVGHPKNKVLCEGTYLVNGTDVQDAEFINSKIQADKVE